MENHKIEIDLNINISENGKVTKRVKSKDIKPLSAYTVAEIKEIEKRGEVEKYFKVGDKLYIKLDNDEILTVAIADFYHDTDENGNLVPITFTAVNLLEESCSMDDMDEYLENLFSKRLPADIRDGIIPVQKDGKTCKLFLHSEMEIFGRTIYSNDNTGKQYPYYAEKCHRCKFKNSEEYSRWWWERSAYYDYSPFFCYVNSNGGANGNNAYYSYGVAPAFGF